MNPVMSIYWNLRIKNINQICIVKDVFGTFMYDWYWYVLKIDDYLLDNLISQQWRGIEHYAIKLKLRLLFLLKILYVLLSHFVNIGQASGSRVLWMLFHCLPYTLLYNQ